MTEAKDIVKKADPIYELLGQYKNAIKNVLPSHVTPERMLRVAYTVIQKNPKLRECSKASLVNCVLEASMLGLEIGRTAHIVPYKVRGVPVATFIPDYKGFIDLAHRSNRIESFPFKPVYANDDFEYSEGTTRYIKHKPHRGDDRGDLVAAYAIVFFKHGGYDFEVVEQPDIDAIKRMSPGARMSDSPWNKPDLEWTMWCKTAVRRLAKRVPQSPELQRAAYLEEMAEAGLKQDFQRKDIDDVIDIAPVTGDLTDKLQQGAEKAKPPEKKVIEHKEPEQKKEPPKQALTDKEIWEKEFLYLRSGFEKKVLDNIQMFKDSTYMALEGRKKWDRVVDGKPWPLDTEFNPPEEDFPPDPPTEDEPVTTADNDEGITMLNPEFVEPGASHDSDNQGIIEKDDETPLFNQKGELNNPPPKQEKPDKIYLVCPKTKYRINSKACEATCKVKGNCEEYQRHLDGDIPF